jgi:O-antigen/teichoic acid export membrane protein
LARRRAHVETPSNQQRHAGTAKNARTIQKDIYPVSSTQEQHIGKLASQGIAWSIAQNWGGRLITFLLFVVLARLLSPAQFGLASAAAIVVLLINQISEFGFGDAIIQRRNFTPADANLPFFVSIALSLILAIVCAFNAERVGTLLAVKGLGPIVAVLCFVAPLTTISQFQEFQYQRNFLFRRLALRVLIANVVAGVIGVSMAMAGYGVWALVSQSYLVVIVGLVWVWSRPIWRASTEWRPTAFWELLKFGAPVSGMRLVDFASSRFFELVLLNRYGIAVFGLYAAGSRLYQTLTQLLQTALNNVSMTILSRISHDRERMAQIYLKIVSLAALVFAPIFVGSATLSPEISLVLFGHAWAGVEHIARPLLLLGAVQSVQFINGPYLASRGRPAAVFGISVLKNLGTVLGVLFIPVGGMVGFVQVFAIMQLLGMPVSFFATTRELGLRFSSLLPCALPAACASVLADQAVGFTRPWIAAYHLPALPQGMVLGALFAASYALLIALLGFKQAKAAAIFLKTQLRRS